MNPALQSIDTLADVDLRDHFAGLALHAMLSGRGDRPLGLPANDRIVAERAYSFADAMLVARDQNLNESQSTHTERIIHVQQDRDSDHG